MRDHLQQLVGNGRRVLAIRQIFEHDHELVAAEARHQIARAQALFEPFGHQAQQPIACSMTQGIVDLLEAIDVDEQQRQRRSGAARLLNCVIERLVEHDAVREARQLVEVRELANALLRFMPLDRDLGEIGDAVEEFELARGRMPCLAEVRRENAQHRPRLAANRDRPARA